MKSSLSRKTYVAVAIALLIVAAALMSIAGASNAGYRHVRDFASSLASHGATTPWFGIGALLSFSAMHAVAAYGIRRHTGLVLVPVTLGMSTLASMAIASFRLHCPSGAAGCYLGAVPDIPFLSDQIHFLSSFLYEIAMELGMLGMAWKLRRARELRGYVVASVALAALSFLLFTIAGMGLAPGMAGAVQRAWVAVHACWLIVSLGAAWPLLSGRAAVRT